MDPIQGAVLKTGTELVAESAKAANGLLLRLVGPAVDEIGGLWKDRIAAIRHKNLIDVVTRSNEMCESAGLKPNKVTLKIIHPLLEGCSVEEDADLKEMWSAILANASVESSSVDPSFVNIMREMSRAEAKVMGLFYDLGANYPNCRLVVSHRGYEPFTCQVFEGIHFRNSITSVFADQPVQDVVATLSKLCFRLGLIATRTTDESMVSYFLSVMGTRFMDACQPPRRTKSE